MSDESVEKTTSQNLIKAFLRFRRMGMSKGNKFAIMEAQLPNGLHHSEMLMLFAIKELEPKYPEGISVSDLSGYLGVKSPTITPMITNLEKSGMLNRSMDLNDRRIVRIKLLEGGNRLLEEKAEHFINRIQGLVEYLGEEKSNRLAELMNEVYDYFSNSHRQ